MVQRMEGRRRLEWHLRTFRGGLARAEAAGFPRADNMVIAKRWNHAGHVARIRTVDPMLHPTFWECVTSHCGGITHDDEGTIEFFTDDLGSNDAGDNTLMTAGPRPALNGRRWRGTDPSLNLT